jgi:hypothetical protein
VAKTRVESGSGVVASKKRSLLRRGIPQVFATALTRSHKCINLERQIEHFIILREDAASPLMKQTPICHCFTAIKKPEMRQVADAGDTGAFWNSLAEETKFRLRSKIQQGAPLSPASATCRFLRVIFYDKQCGELVFLHPP